MRGGDKGIMHLGYNVAWVMTRLHNLRTASRILSDEAKELEKVGLDEAASIATKASNDVYAMTLREIETIQLDGIGKQDKE